MSEEEKVKEEIVEQKKPDFRNYLNVYEFETTLPGMKQTVKFKPITTGQLKKLLVYENETDPMMIENALDELMMSSIITEGFSIDDIYLQDRFFLLVEMRRKSKGDQYKFQYDCNECGSQTMQYIDLLKLKTKELPEDIDNVVKIDDNVSVKVGHTTRRSQKLAYESMKKKKGLSEMQKSTEMSIYTHAYDIKSITVPEGEITDSNIEEKKFFLEGIPSQGYEKIRDWFTNNDFGVEFKFNIACRGCDKKETIDIPLDDFFF
jgi:hypothetical protein